MSSFFKNLFGGKKNSKVTKKAISRRLELLGLEERVVPAVTANFATGVLSITAGTTGTTPAIPDSFDVVANADGTLTVTSSAGVTAGSAAVTVTAQGGNAFLVSVVSGASNVTSLSLLGDGTVGAPTTQTFNVGAINSTAFGANFGLNIDMGTTGSGSTDALNFNGAITLKGTGALTVANVDAFTIAAAGDIVAATGAVGITSAGTLSTAGDVTTNSGNITYSAVTSPFTLSGNVAITSTSGNLNMGAVTGSSSNLTISEGTGTVTVGAANLGTGNLTVTSTATPSSGSAISLAAVTAGAVSLTGAGDVSVSGAVIATGVNAKSTAGNVLFGNTVTTSGIAGFTSEATAAAKATSIAAKVNVQNGANALVTGNLVSAANNAPEIAVDGTATINITGKVDASVAGNDLKLTALNGAITIGGAVGSATTAMGDLIAIGNTTFTAKGAVTVDQLGLSNFGTSISFAEAVKVGGTLGANVNAAGTGTISFAKTIEATSSLADVLLTSVNGALTVSGNITGKDMVQIFSTSGAISVAGITTDQAGADITIVSDTGSITTSGAISTSGATTSSDDAGIEIDTVTSGNITIGGNVSTSGGGDILLGADTGTTASGTGNLTINGTVSTTGTTESGDVVIGTGGTGTVTVNKALSTGAATTPGDIVLVAVTSTSQVNTINVSKDVTISSADGVAFITTGSTNTISLASGANVTAVSGVLDLGSGNLNLASNITVSNASVGIELDSLSINLTGAVSMKSSATTAANGDITITSVNGA